MPIDLRNLHTDRNREKYTTGKAPHKALLLLSLPKLQEKGLLDPKHIRFDDVGIHDTWQTLWGCLGYGRAGKINMPLFHLESDGFYGFSKGTPKHRGYTPSLRQLREAYGEAALSDEFLAMTATEDGRRLAYETLLTGGYFSAEQIARLNAQLGVLDKSFEYEKALEAETTESFKEERAAYEFGREKQERAPEFRRVVLRAYHNRCAVCGLSIVSDTGVSPVQAAHILPFAQFHNDDPRNGIAMCHLHHWAFDSQLLAVSTSYKVKVSNTIDEEQPERVLTGLMGKGILLPEEELFRPAKEALEWRVRNWFVQ